MSLSSYNTLGLSFVRQGRRCLKYLRERNYRKILKISPGLIFFKGPFLGAYFWRGLSTEGNLRLKIDWAALIVGRKFTVCALFYFVFEGNFQVQPPREGLYLEERFNGGFFTLRVWGAYIWRGYKWRGLFSEFYGTSFSAL